MKICKKNLAVMYFVYYSVTGHHGTWKNVRISPNPIHKLCQTCIWRILFASKCNRFSQVVILTNYFKQSPKCGREVAEEGWIKKKEEVPLFYHYFEFSSFYCRPRSLLMWLFLEVPKTQVKPLKCFVSIWIIMKITCLVWPMKNFLDIY